MTRILLIRHCEAEGNIKRLFQGHTDADISENGERQLLRLAERCKNLPMDFLYSSPLIRARKTARAAGSHLGLPLKIDPGLIEINGGVWEGKPWSCFPKLYPEQARRWNLSPWEFHPEGGESMRALYERIWNAVTDLVRAHAGSTLGIVSHGCAIRNFLCRAHGYPIEALNEISWSDNTGLSIIDFDPALRPTIVLENDASHLSDELSTLGKQTWWRPESRASMIFE